MSPPLGRDDERAALQEAFAGLASGRGGLVIVTGDAGIGKTDLVGRLVDAVPRTRPLTTAWASAGTGPDGTLRAWAELARALLRTRPSAAVEGFGALVDQARTAGWTASSLDDACALLGRAAREGALLLVVDDAHRLDPRSTELLDRMLVVTSSQPLLLVLAGRGVPGQSTDAPTEQPIGPPTDRPTDAHTHPPTDAHTHPPTHPPADRPADPEVAAGPAPGLDLTALAAGLRGRPRTWSLELGPLDPADLRVLAARAGLQAEDERAERAVRAAAGNPLLLLALVRAGDDTDAWGPLGATARALLTARVRAVDDTGALVALALLDRPTTTSLLAQTTGSDHARVELALATATATGLVERSGRLGRYRLAMPVLRHAVVAATDRDAIRAVHAAIAQVLSRDGAAGRQLTEAVAHLIASGATGAEVARACLQAALWEEHAGEYEAAEELAGQGLEGGGDDPTEVELLRCLGRCLGRAGRVPAAREALERAVALAGRALAPLERARAVADLARVDHDFVATSGYRIAQLEQSLATVEALPAAEQATEAALRVKLQALLSVALYFTDLPRSRRLADQARQSSLECDVPDVVVLAHDVWAFAAVGPQSADAVAALAAQWADRSADGTGRQLLAGSVSCSAVGPALVRGDRGTLDFSLARLQHHRERLATVRLRGLLDVALMTRAMLDGDVAEVDRLAPVVHASPSADVVALGAVNELVWCFHTGRPWQPDAQAVATVLPTPGLVALFVLGSLVAAAVHGDRESVDALRSWTERRERVLPLRHDLTADVSACLVAAAGGLLDDPELCRAGVDALGDRLDEFAVVAWLACAGPVGIYLAYAHAGLGELDAALDANAHAEAATRRVGSGPWTVHCLVQRAELLERTGDPRHRLVLEQALELAEDLGIDGLADRARRLLEGPQATGTVPQGQLREILELAAEGRTNDQIARALFVSVSTVERRLSQLYRELGVRNRAEAIARLRAERSGPVEVSTVDLRLAGGRTALSRPGRTGTGPGAAG